MISSWFMKKKNENQNENQKQYKFKKKLEKKNLWDNHRSMHTRTQLPNKPPRSFPTLDYMVAEPWNRLSLTIFLAWKQASYCGGGRRDRRTNCLSGAWLYNSIMWFAGTWVGMSCVPRSQIPYHTAGSQRMNQECSPLEICTQPLLGWAWRRGSRQTEGRPLFPEFRKRFGNDFWDLSYRAKYLGNSKDWSVSCDEKNRASERFCNELSTTERGFLRAIYAIDLFTIIENYSILTLRNQAPSVLTSQLFRWAILFFDLYPSNVRYLGAPGTYQTIPQMMRMDLQIDQLIHNKPRLLNRLIWSANLCTIIFSANFHGNSNSPWHEWFAPHEQAFARSQPLLRATPLHICEKREMITKFVTCEDSEPGVVAVGWGVCRRGCLERLALTWSTAFRRGIFSPAVGHTEAWLLASQRLWRPQWEAR